MLVVISPAKTLDFETPAHTSLASQPEFLSDSKDLIATLKTYSPQKLATLMSLSDKLAALNTARYEAWSPPFNQKNAKQSVLAFKGDVYTGLQAEDFSEANITYSQQHLRILSGLYGVLKPFDLIQPYRLEMGTKLKTKGNKDLYGFWADKLAQKINQASEATGESTLINLASQEYFKALPKKALECDVITPVFKDLKNGSYKVISFFAKRARGKMARYIIKKRLKRPEAIKNFAEDGYVFDAELSDAKQWVFTRDQAPS